MLNMRVSNCILTTLILTSPALAFDLPAPTHDEDFLQSSEVEAKLGQLLFYDPILSGNKNISCSTCHHPKLGTSDGLSLGMGEGGIGLGPDRISDLQNMPEGRIPRNAPALYNLGALEYVSMFHDGRVENINGTLRVPIEDPFFDSVSGILATQAAFPVLSADEMAGHISENAISKIVRKGRFSAEGGAWDLIAKRVAEIPEYQTFMAEAYPEIAAGRDIKFHDISNAIAGFIAVEFRADNSPFDQYLRGEKPLNEDASQGLTLFYEDLGCASCHSGIFQTDHGFHAMGQPQFGPGKAMAFERGARDEGRFRVTGNTADLYAFRTPSLRNVALTSPYGHSGAYSDLWEFVSAHAAPNRALEAWDPSYAVLSDLDVSDWETWKNPDDIAAIKAAIEIPDRQLTAVQLDQILAFLEALTDDPSRLGVPKTVPSGLDFEH